MRKTKEPPTVEPGFQTQVLANKIEQVDVRKIVPHPKNARRSNVGRIAALIRENGFYRPLTVQKSTNFIIAGNHAYKAAMSLGMETVPAIFVDVDDDRAMRILIGDNKSTDDAEYDEKALLELLIGLDDPMDLSGTGFTGDDMELLRRAVAKAEPKAAKDADPEDPDKVSTRFAHGEVWAIGRHVLACGDCRDQAVWQRLVERLGPAECIWTDPPYGVDYVGKTKDKLKIQGDGIGELCILLNDAFARMHEFAVEGCPVYVCSPASYQDEFMGAWRKSGIKLHVVLTWVKNTLVMGHSDYHWKHEPIIYGWKGSRDNRPWFGGRDKTTVLNFDRPTRSTEHPTMKPIDLISHCLENSSREGAVVYDPFGGSGSTMVACENLSRRCAMIELDPRYCEVIARRMEAAFGIEAVRVDQGERPTPQRGRKAKAGTP